MEGTETIDALRAKRAALFDEICRLKADLVGWWDPNRLSDASRAQVREEAQEDLDQWAKDAAAHTLPPEPLTPFQRLLADHHDLGKRIDELARS